MIGKAILALYIYNLTKRGNVQSILPLIEKIKHISFDVFYLCFHFFHFEYQKNIFFFLQTVH